MNEQRNKLKREIIRCDALAIQNEKDGYKEAAKQYRQYCAVVAKQLAEIEREQLKKILSGQ